jgi:hypothetical protein
MSKLVLLTVRAHPEDHRRSQGAAVTSALATRPNQFVETSRASILAHIVGIKFALASGFGASCAVRPKQLISIRPMKPSGG